MNKKLENILTYGGGLFIGSLIYLLASVIYYEFRDLRKFVHANAPVVTNMQVVNSKVKDGKIYINVVGNKERDCGQPISMIVDYGYAYENKAKTLIFLDDVTTEGIIKNPQENIPDLDGNINFGWWEIDPSPNNKPMKISSIHDCDGVLVTTKIGSWLFEDYGSSKFK